MFNISKRAIKDLKIVSSNFTKYSSHHPLSADTVFKFLALILFEILHLQNFISNFSKSRSFTMGDNSIQDFMGTEVFTYCNLDLTQTASKYTYSLTNNSPQFS